jgi:hypothetical protein
MKAKGEPGKAGGPGNLVKLGCFAQKDIDGGYFNERDYGMRYRLAPNIQYAFEELDKAVAEAGKLIKDRIEAEAKAKL